MSTGQKSRVGRRIFFDTKLSEEISKPAGQLMLFCIIHPGILSLDQLIQLR